MARLAERFNGPVRAGNSESSRPKISAEQINKHFYAGGRWLQVLDDVEISAGEGEFVSIIGPSGCGKSTLLSILAGLESVDSGRVMVDGRDVTGCLGYAGFMPQRDLLLPWKTVLDNTSLGLELRGMPKKRAREEAARHFRLFGLEGFERQYPATLSGGMRQRAAFLRTVLSQRDILLLDEPFGALDSLTRASMQEWLLNIWDSLRKTIVFVTHDIDEALFVSDRVYVMCSRPGHVREIVNVPFDRPRDYQIVTSSPFVDLKHELLALIKRRHDEFEA